MQEKFNKQVITHLRKAYYQLVSHPKISLMKCSLINDYIDNMLPLSARPQLEKGACNNVFFLLFRQPPVLERAMV